MPIPKHLHFIWFGEKSLPTKYVNNIKSWIRINPDFKFTLWVDSQGTNKEIIDNYKNNSFFAEEIARGVIDIRDAQAAGLISLHARFELDNLTPNYGAASDITRYHILKKLGGGYLDCDVIPQPIALSESSDIWKREAHSEKLHFVEASFQHHVLTPNDFLVCNKDNRVITALIEQIEQRYRVITPQLDSAQIGEKSWEKMSSLYHLTHNFSDNQMDMAIFRTGPQGLNQLVSQDASLVPYLNRVKEETVREPMDNTGADGSWVNILPASNQTIDAALKKAMSEVKFELSKHGSGILRLESIAYNLIESLESQDYSRAFIIQSFLREVEKEDLSRVMSVQLSFFDRQIEDFYKQHHLLGKSILVPTENVSRPDFETFLTETYTKDQILESYLERRINFLMGLVNLYEYCVTQPEKVPELDKKTLKVALRALQKNLLEEVKERMLYTPPRDFKLSKIKSILHHELGKNVASSFFSRRAEQREAIAIKKEIQQSDSIEKLYEILTNYPAKQPRTRTNLNKAYEKFAHHCDFAINSLQSGRRKNRTYKLLEKLQERLSKTTEELKSQLKQEQSASPGL